MAKHGKQEDTPATAGVVHERQKKAVRIVRDVYEGTLRMRERGETYLPKFPREPADSYQARLSGSVLFNGFRRTVLGLTGMVFRKDPQLDDDVPDEVQDHAENIDQAGRAIEVFARDVFENGLRDGHSHIFVDMQALEGEFQNQLEEERAGLRPYWVNILKEDVLSFRATRVQGEHILTQFVYRESVTKTEGDFAERTVDRYRVYRLRPAGGLEGVERDVGMAVQWEVWRKKDEGASGGSEDDFVVEESGVMDIGRIPLSTFYADRRGFLESDPPLLDLAMENIKHYQIRSDRDTGLQTTNNPMPVFIGIEADELQIGSNVGITLPEGGDAKYLEPTGAGLSEAKDELRDIEQRMAALGLAMLQRDTRAAETAEARRIEKSETDASLSSAARSLQDALTEALGYHADWLDQDDGGTISINRDFETQLLDPRTIEVLARLVDQGKLSLETLWELLEAGERLPEGFDAEQEMERILTGGGSLLEGLVEPAENGGGPPEAEEPEGEPAGVAE